MLHRAILGSFERFIGILIENYEGRFPVWLAPVQVMILSITDRSNNTCRILLNHLLKNGYRVECDLRNEKIGFKIREHTLQRVPYLVIIGDKEEENNQLSIRTREGKDLGSLSLDEFKNLLQASINLKGKISQENNK